ncbi:MAG: coenzyme F420-0:L-glutamate ligase [Sumerlaeia bacterium]
MTAQLASVVGFTQFQANPNRSLTIQVEGKNYLRVPLKTPVLTPKSNLVEACKNAMNGYHQAGDILFISEKAVAVTQGRAIPESEITIGFTARVLWRCVAKVPYGIGLRRPSSMQCAVNECGAARIWFAALVGALGKLIGRKGDFYRIAGPQAAMIDAATTSPLQPDCVIMGPSEPNRVASQLAVTLGLPVAIVDVNDVGGSWVVGKSKTVPVKLLEAALKDNPLGQGTECTPMGLLRLQQ